MLTSTSVVVMVQVPSLSVFTMVSSPIPKVVPDASLPTSNSNSMVLLNTVRSSRMVGLLAMALLHFMDRLSSTNVPVVVEMARYSTICTIASGLNTASLISSTFYLAMAIGSIHQDDILHHHLPQNTIQSSIQGNTNQGLHLQSHKSLMDNFKLLTVHPHLA